MPTDETFAKILASRAQEGQERKTREIALFERSCMADVFDEIFERTKIPPNPSTEDAESKFFRDSLNLIRHTTLVKMRRENPRIFIGRNDHYHLVKKQSSCMLAHTICDGRGNIPIISAAALESNDGELSIGITTGELELGVQAEGASMEAISSGFLYMSQNALEGIKYDKESISTAVIGLLLR